MLNIYFGDMPSAIYNTEIYFKNTYEDSWILDDFAKKVIKKVDGSDVIDAQAIKSPVLGIIPPTELSGGVKTLLLLKTARMKCSMLQHAEITAHVLFLNWQKQKMLRSTCVILWTLIRQDLRLKF